MLLHMVGEASEDEDVPEKAAGACFTEPSLPAMKVTCHPCNAMACPCYTQPKQRGAGRQLLVWQLQLEVKFSWCRLS